MIKKESVDPKFCKEHCVAGRFVEGMSCAVKKEFCLYPNPRLKKNEQLNKPLK